MKFSLAWLKQYLDTEAGAAEIAAKLYQSLATVKATLTRVLGKLGCTNRTQVAILVHDAHYLDE